MKTAGEIYREELRDEGRQEGRQEGMNMFLQMFVKSSFRKNRSAKEIQQTLVEDFSLTNEEANKLLNQ